MSPHNDVTARQPDYMADVVGRLQEQMVSPREFGRLEAEVKALQASNAALSGQVQELSADVKELLAMANRSRGGFWAGMTIASGLGALGMWAADHLMRR